MLTTRTVDIDSAGRRLRGTVTERAGGRPSSAAVLFVHGLGSSQEAYLPRAERTVLALGLRCLTFDLSGHGADKANLSHYSIYEHIDDVVSAYDHLTVVEGADAARMGACGASYGAYLVALLSARRNVKRLVLRAPALASDVEFPAPKNHRPSDFDSIRAVSNFAGDVLVVESELDERIPHSQILAYLRASRNSSHEVIPRARHALELPAWDEKFVGFLIDWFKNL
ncbi:alpha/beta hydrolase family protein [Actinoplanes sp. GCM10030250]|uniref:alpha/beta hydrolase family protein n=1 Tax=Actinoplanes sp. GCM10030250 TaxID=3273376 RepID=UPI00360AE957